MEIKDMSLQEIQLELIRRASFNGLDGEAVVEDLNIHRDLWEAVIIEGSNLIKLRDLKSGLWNVDTLFILSIKGKEDELRKLAKSWNADELGWVGKKEASELLGTSMVENKTLLRVWWD